MYSGKYFRNLVYPKPLNNSSHAECKSCPSLIGMNSESLSVSINYKNGRINSWKDKKVEGISKFCPDWQNVIEQRGEVILDLHEHE